MVIRGQRIAPIYIYNCLSVVIIMICLLVYVKPQKGNSLGTFDWHGDPCMRGVQYCAEDVERCEHCSEKRNKCNTSEIPRNCDAFCSYLKLISLNKEIAVVNAKYERLKKDKEILQERNKEGNDSNVYITVGLGLTAGLSVTVLLACLCRQQMGTRNCYSSTQIPDDKKEKESLVSKDSAVDLESQDGNFGKQSKGPTAEDAGQPSQDATLKSIPPTSPDGTYKQVFNN